MFFDKVKKGKDINFFKKLLVPNAIGDVNNFRIIALRA